VAVAKPARWPSSRRCRSPEPGLWCSWASAASEWPCAAAGVQSSRKLR